MSRSVEVRPTALTFPEPCGRVSMNDRLHWAHRNRLIQTWRKAATIHARQQLRASERHHPPCYVRVTFPAKQNRRRDPHNQAPTVKVIIDGLVDAGIWVDDTDEFVIVLDPRFRITDDGIVTVELTPRTEAAA